VVEQSANGLSIWEVRAIGRLLVKHWVKSQSFSRPDAKVRLSEIVTQMLPIATGREGSN